MTITVDAAGFDRDTRGPARTGLARKIRAGKGIWEATYIIYTHLRPSTLRSGISWHWCSGMQTRISSFQGQCFMTIPVPEMYRK